MNSWKEIATFFDKDVRTVRRWEATRKLPVRRMPGGGRSGVFAYVSELQQWLTEADGRVAVLESPALELNGSGAQAGDGADTVLESGDREPVDPDLPPEVAPLGAVTSRVGSRDSSRRAGWVVAVAAVALLVGVTLWYGRTLRGSASTSQATATGTGDKPSSNPEAQELYLRGHYLWDQRTEASLTQAVDLYTQAIVHDPHFAAAYAGLADSYILLRQYGRMADNEAFPRALAASRQALALDDQSAEAHRSYAFLLNYWIWNFPAADLEFQRSINIRPSDAQTHSWYATSLYSEGRFQEALREIDTARRLQPDSISILTNRGLLLSYVDANAGLAYLVELEKDNADFPTLHSYLATLYGSRGDYAAFLDQVRIAATLRKDSEDIALIDSAKQELETHGPRAMLGLLAAKYGAQVDAGRPNAMPVAMLYAWMRNKERTLRYMTVAYQRHEASFLSMNTDPVYRFLSDTPEYKALLAKRNTSLDMATAMKTGGKQ